MQSATKKTYARFKINVKRVFIAVFHLGTYSKLS